MSVNLRQQLPAALDPTHLGQSFLGDLDAPIASLSAVAVPAPGGGTQTALTIHVDTAALLASITALAERALPIAGSLPSPQTILATIEQTLQQLEQLSQQDLAADVEALIAQVRAAIVDPPEGSRLALVVQLIDMLQHAPQAQPARDLLAMLARRAGIDTGGIDPYVDGLRALDGLIRFLGALMCLETVLSEGERLGRAMTAAVRPGVLASALDALDALLAGSGVGVDHGDPAAVTAAVDAAIAVAGRFDALEEELSAALGMGEATLVYLDMARFQTEIDHARAALRSADLDPLGRLVRSVAPALQPFVALDLASLPRGELGALLDRIESELAGVAASIASLDPAELVAPMTNGIHAVTAPLHDLNQLLAGAIQSIRAAIDEVRAAVQALPFQDVADAVRAFLDPIAHALDAITALLEEIQHALETAAADATAALTAIDTAVTNFKNTLDGFFRQAKGVLDGAHLDQILASIGEAVQAFSALLSQAEMQPYFDTAVGAINAATSVISAVPFGLLPESMKADVDAVVAPIRNTDADAAETAVEGVLHIGLDGKFQARADIDAALREVAGAYKALVDAVKKNHPRTLLKPVDDKLNELAAQVRALSPQLTLQPVADAIAVVKQAINDVDLDHALAPVRDVFTQIDRALDQYSLSQLVQPLQQRITAVRTAIVDRIQLDRWSPALDDVQARGLALLDTLSPERLRPLIENAANELLAFLQRIPDVDATRPIGTIVAAVLGAGSGLRISPDSFPVVATWIGGASGVATLSAHAAAMADAFAATLAAVDALDLTAAAPVVARMASFLAAERQLASALHQQSPEAVRLNAILPRLDAAARVAALTDKHAHFRAALAAAVAQVADLRAAGFSEVDVRLAEFRAALVPLEPAWRQVQSLFAALGIDPEHLSVAGVVRTILSEAPPERFVAIVMPLFDAFRGRVSALMAAVVAPLKDAVHELTTLVNAFDLAPLGQAADGIVADAKQQINRLSPDELLKEPLASFAHFKQVFVATDPLAPITQLLTAMRDVIARVLPRLSLEVLLEVPLQIFDDIVAELERVDPSTLLEPVLAQLDAIAQQVDTGLDQTVAAFKQLQAALPAPGGGVSSVSVSFG